jgi:hypothetical protein
MGLLYLLQIQNTSVLGSSCAWPKVYLQQSDCSGQILQISLQAQKTRLTYESGHRSTTVRLVQHSPPFWYKGDQRRAHGQTGECIVYHVGWTSQHYFRRITTRHSTESLKQDSKYYRIHRVRLQLGPRFKVKQTYYGRTNKLPSAGKSNITQ